MLWRFNGEPLKGLLPANEAYLHVLVPYFLRGDLR